MTKAALTIAGFDSGGGAGVTADMATFHAFGLHATGVVAALTAQNSHAVADVTGVDPDFVVRQLKTVCADFDIGAVKTGMLLDIDIVNAVATTLIREKAANLVIDPVMIASSGAELLDHEGRQAMVERLFPLATLVTPNIPEAEELSQIKIEDDKSAEKAAEIIAAMGPANVIITGGHREGPEVVDLFYMGRSNGGGADGEISYLHRKRIETPHTHGTGCVFSAAVTANLALGKTIFDAVSAAEVFMSQALERSYAAGSGRGPVNPWEGSWK